MYYFIEGIILNFSSFFQTYSESVVPVEKLLLLNNFLLLQKLLFTVIFCFAYINFIELPIFLDKELKEKPFTLKFSISETPISIPAAT